MSVSDVGQVVNPAGVHAQFTSGTIDGISIALGLEITVENGRALAPPAAAFPKQNLSGR